MSCLNWSTDSSDISDTSRESSPERKAPVTVKPKSVPVKPKSTPKRAPSPSTSDVEMSEGEVGYSSFVEQTNKNVYKPPTEEEKSQSVIMPAVVKAVKKPKKKSVKTKPRKLTVTELRKLLDQAVKSDTVKVSSKKSKGKIVKKGAPKKAKKVVGKKTKK